MSRDLKSKRRGPEKVKSAVVFLHGYGADGADLLSLADPLGPHLSETAFYAPDAPQPCAGNPFGRQWFPIPWLDGSTEEQAQQGMAAAADDLNAFLDTMLTAEGLTADRLAVVGFSQGTMMALEVLPRRAHPVAGIVAFSGRLLNADMLAQQAVSKPPVLLLHGDQDPVVPFQDMGLAGDALVAAGFDTFGHVMKGTGHGISPDGLSVALAFLKERLA